MVIFCHEIQKPSTTIIKANFDWLMTSGPDATSIGSPSVEDNTKECSIWDEVNEQYNIKEESCESKVYE